MNFVILVTNLEDLEVLAGNNSYLVDESSVVVLVRGPWLYPVPSSDVDMLSEEAELDAS